MKGRAVIAVGVAVGVVVVVSSAVAPDAAAQPVTTSATGYSAGAASGAADLSATLTITGSVGGLVGGLINPVVTSALQPMVSALQSTVNGTVAGTLGSSSSDTAGTPAQQTGPKPGAFPGDAFPSPCTASSPTQPCYSAPAQAIDGSPLTSVSVNGIRGYTQQTQASDDAANPIFGRAQLGSASVSALPGISALANPVVSTGVVDAKANCPNDGKTDPTADGSASNVSLLGGAVTFDVLSGSVTNLVVGGTPIASLPSLASTTVAGAMVRQYGGSVRVDVPLTLDQLLAGLQLSSSAVSELTSDLTSASLTLTVVVGPYTSVTSTSAKAWGLGVGVDLSGSLIFDLGGLAGARVTLPTGIGGGNYGNLADLRLAYVSCSSGSAPTSSSSDPAVPPQNV